MKTLINRIKKYITPNKGELLVETIISIALLSVLLLAVVSIILTCLKTVNSSVANTERFQEEIVNNAIIANYSDGTETTIYFLSSDGISAHHDIYFNNDIIAFTPAEDD